MLQSVIIEEKRKELQNELQDLKGPKRKEILSFGVREIAGDLSENAEYHQTREEQGKLEERILYIERILQSPQTLRGAAEMWLDIGSKVVVQKEGKKEDIAYTIVGSEDTRYGERQNLP